MFSVQIYQKESQNEWNNFIKESKNGHFMFIRNYMEYHSHRFDDFSLIFRDHKKRIAALLPANKNEEILYSHQGLTFGGLILGKKTSSAHVVDIFDTLIQFLKNKKFKKLVYKRIPNLYASYPSEEDLYALYLCGAKLVRCDLNSTIDLSKEYKYSKGRKWAIGKAKKGGVIIRESENFQDFWSILTRALEKYDASPTHSVEEIGKLKSKFPNNIRLFCAWKEDSLLAGTVVYLNGDVVHTQYMATTDEGRDIGALDYCIDMLIKNEFKEKKYFDFGISTENEGKSLNEGLLAQKEGFGARGTVHEFYEVEIA